MILPDIELGRRKILKDCNIKLHKLVAIAFRPNGSIISIETNRLGNGELSDFSWHAEELLANRLHRIKARSRLGKVYVLVARLGRRDGWTMAKPCDGCARKLARVADKVFYVDSRGEVQLYG